MQNPRRNTAMALLLALCTLPCCCLCKFCSLVSLALMLALCFLSSLAEPHPRVQGSGVKLDRDLYPTAGILQSNQIASLPHITTIITFPLEGGVWVRESSQCIIKRHLFLPLVQIKVKLDARPSRIALVGVAPPDYFLSCCFLCTLVSDTPFDTLTQIFHFSLTSEHMLARFTHFSTLVVH